ncbi:MAG: YdiU family protein [Oscillospiraceae bacterium]|nr:YdiU family protein [Oscillospiraceae bacterium]
MKGLSKAKWNFNNSYKELPEKFYAVNAPTPVRAPKIVAFNEELAECLGAPKDTGAFSGNTIPKGAAMLSQAYAGHQFGHFTMLGDGRAILIGEQVTKFNSPDIQLKGAGRTPYSRGGDGRAALGPMLREYIISDAMHALGIPTTRSLAVVETGETIMREKELPGAILTRVAADHIRVGTFEFASRFGTKEDVACLADYTLKRQRIPLAADENKYLLLLRAAVNKQAFLLAKWQLVGFVHGVMNTDNMTISGETIDYGPCAFMDEYEPSVVFSSIDKYARYSYENQPKIAVWNLSRFAETLLPLLSDDENSAVAAGQKEIDKFAELYQNFWNVGMGAKLGLFNRKPEDDSLFAELLRLMRESKADYTNTFRALTLSEKEVAGTKLFSRPEFHKWNEKWRTRHSNQTKTKSEIETLMKKHNPAAIPRNERVEEVLREAQKGDYEPMNKLLAVLKEPYGYTRAQEEYSKPPQSSCRYQTFCGT